MSDVDLQVKRFASFMIKGNTPIEFAIAAEEVLEATFVNGTIQPLPSGVPYLEGFMHLRDDAIPIINIKTRLGLPPSDYAADAKVAVVAVAGLRVGLLFDDIKDVLVVEGNTIEPVHPVLQTGEGLISDLIKLAGGQRTMQLLDLKRLIAGSHALELIKDAGMPTKIGSVQAQQTYSRFVVFSALNQDYGVPVDKVQEITFLAQIDDVFKNEAIEGAVKLRGNTIPVLSATRLLHTESDKQDTSEHTRVLILDADSYQYGLIVDSVREIISIPDDAIMPLPKKGQVTVSGIYKSTDERNIMLLQVDALIETRKRELKSMARLKDAGQKAQEGLDRSRSRHLITADSYLVFSVGRNFAIELNDVQEIIEPKELMALPAATGYDGRVLNLRGTVVPVINLSAFYNLPPDGNAGDKKLIIARSRSQVIALEVDRILTIYKQVQYSQTPSLNPQFADKKDTLDRLIEFAGASGLTEHVLVLNIKAMIENHLKMTETITTSAESTDTKENIHGTHRAA